MARPSTQLAGRAGEDAAAKLLTQKGYKLITRNFRSRYGEIDLIAQDGNTLVFIEVKARWNTKYGLPEEAITPSKIESIKRTAEYFSMQYPQFPSLMRIDAVLLEVDHGILKRIELVKNISG